MKAMKELLIVMFILLTVILYGQEEEGLASWYGGKFQGRLTASGEVFDTNKLTGAHKTLPFGTIVRVTNLLNDLTVDVRINDRGPFVEGRIIDLSRAAAEEIEMVGMGIVPVKIEVIEQVTADEVDESKEEYTIQVGAFSVEENALEMKNQIEESGLNAILEYTSIGIIRVIIMHIPFHELEETKTILADLGYNDILVK
jgi:rare lipoprotein A